VPEEKPFAIRAAPIAADRKNSRARRVTCEETLTARGLREIAGTRAKRIALARGKRRLGGSGEQGREERMGKGMLTHVTRAIACEHPSLALVVASPLPAARSQPFIALHSPSCIPLPLASGYPAMYAHFPFLDKRAESEEDGRTELFRSLMVARNRINAA